MGFTTNYNLEKQENKSAYFSMDKLNENMDKIDAALSSHELDVNNPHGVTKAQVDLGNVDNTSDANKPVSTATQTALNLKADNLDLTAHTGNTSNPHGVTKEQVGLGNVANVDTTTTANITDILNKRFVTDVQRTVLENISKSVIGELSASILSTDWVGTTAPYVVDIPLSIPEETITSTTHDIKVSLVLSSNINVARQEQEAYSYFSKGEISNTNVLKITCFDYKPYINLNLILEVIKKW